MCNGDVLPAPDVELAFGASESPALLIFLEKLHLHKYFHALRSAAVEFINDIACLDEGTCQRIGMNHVESRRLLNAFEEEKTKKQIRRESSSVSDDNASDEKAEPEWPNELKLTCAGNELVNGLYLRQEGVFEDKPWYRHEDDTYYIRRKHKKWILSSQRDTRMYYSTSKRLHKGWRTDKDSASVGPPPKVHC